MASSETRVCSSLSNGRSQSDIACPGPKLYKPRSLVPDFQYYTFSSSILPRKQTHHQKPPFWEEIEHISIASTLVQQNSPRIDRLEGSATGEQRQKYTKSSVRPQDSTISQITVTMPKAPKDGNPEESRYCKRGCGQLKEHCRCALGHQPGPPDNDPNAPQNVGGQNTGGQNAGGQNTGGGGRGGR
jgi:hypothetical protein